MKGEGGRVGKIEVGRFLRGLLCAQVKLAQDLALALSISDVVAKARNHRISLSLALSKVTHTCSLTRTNS